MGSKTLEPAEAVKRFAKQDIQVQTAKPVMLAVKDAEGKDTDKKRPAFKVDMKPLAADHVLSAVQREDGTAVLVTIDGRRYEAARSGAAAQ